MRIKNWAKEWTKHWRNENQELGKEEDFLFTSFIRIHWYTVPPTFQFTVWEDGFDYIVFFFTNGNIKYDTTFYA